MNAASGNTAERNAVAAYVPAPHAKMTIIYQPNLWGLMYDTPQKI
jgi:hypothetical protein